MPDDDDQWSSYDTQSLQIIFYADKLIVTGYALGPLEGFRSLTGYAADSSLGS